MWKTAFKKYEWYGLLRPYFKFFKGCLRQISLGPFKNTLSHITILVASYIFYCYLWKKIHNMSRHLFIQFWAYSKFLFNFRPVLPLIGKIKSATQQLFCSSWTCAILFVFLVGSFNFWGLVMKCRARRMEKDEPKSLGTFVTFVLLVLTFMLENKKSCLWSMVDILFFRVKNVY